MNDDHRSRRLCSWRRLPHLCLAAAVGVTGCAVAPVEAPSAVAGPVCPRPATATVDVSGLTAFLAVADVLKSDHEPSEGLWGEMERSPGYAALLQSEFPREHFRKAFRLAFSPSKAGELRAAVQSGEVPYLEHYVDALAHLEEIRALGTAPRLAEAIEDAGRRAQEWLPPSPCPRGAAPVALVIFAPDARGYSPIVVDALLATRMPPDALRPFLAHESHHFYRNLLEPRPHRACLSGTDAEVFWALHQLQAEGVADQLNMRAELQAEHGSAAVEQYRAWVDESPSRLRSFEALVLDRRQRDPAVLARAIRETLPRSGHPNGFYMASVILGALGRDRLLTHLHDPIAFVRDYQEAAAAAGAPFVFSSRFERHLGGIDERLRSCDDRERGDGGSPS